MKDRAAELRATQAAQRLLGKKRKAVGAPGWERVARELLLVDDRSAAAAALDRCDLALASKARPDVQRRSSWMRSWTSPPVPDPDVNDATSGDERLVIGVIDYESPDRSVRSKNIGDYVQTLASVGHLARHRNIRFAGESPLAGFLRQLQQRVPEHYQVSGPQREVVLTRVFRDASGYQVIPDGTYTLVFGWFMRRLFDKRLDFPLHRGVRPIFMSFHVHEQSMLTSAAIEYLKAWGPVGCRDIATLRLLSGHGVPAFFSGCLTTTIDMTFPVLSQKELPARATRIYVDAPRRPGDPPGDRAGHRDLGVLGRSLADNLDVSASLLDHYRRCYRSMTTARLHAYLPASSLGMDTTFRPRYPDDPRFTGLAPLSSKELSEMRQDISGQLNAVYSALLRGDSHASIRRTWNDAVAPAVAQSEELLSRFAMQYGSQ